MISLKEKDNTIMVHKTNINNNKIKTQVDKVRGWQRNRRLGTTKMNKSLEPTGYMTSNMEEKFASTKLKIKQIMQSLLLKCPEKTNINIMKNKAPSTAKPKQKLGKNSIITITPNPNNVIPNAERNRAERTSQEMGCRTSKRK